MPAVLGLWFLRKVSYALNDVARAAEASLVYGATLAFGAALLVTIQLTSVGCRPRAARASGTGRERLALAASRGRGDGAFERTGAASRSRAAVQPRAPTPWGEHSALVAGAGCLLGASAIDVGWLGARRPSESGHEFRSSGPTCRCCGPDAANNGSRTSTPPWAALPLEARPPATFMALGLGYWVLLACFSSFALEVVYGSASADLVLLVDVVGAVALLTGTMAWTRAEL